MAFNVFFDTETTGLSKKDKIIQIGGIITDEKGNLYEDGIYNEFCLADTPIKLKAIATHGTRQNMIDNEGKFVDTDFFHVLNKLNSNENYLIAHNLPYDLKMLEKEGFVNNFNLIDTYQCAKHLYIVGKDGKDDDDGNESDFLDKTSKYIPDYQLQTFRYKLLTDDEEKKMAEKYKIEIKAHDAIGDVVILKLFLEKLFFRVKREYNLDNNQVMDKLVEISNPKEVFEYPTMPFGKHKGRTFEEMKNDKTLNKYGKPEGIGYLRYLRGEQESLGEKADLSLLYTLKKFLG